MRTSRTTVRVVAAVLFVGVLTALVIAARATNHPKGSGRPPASAPPTSPTVAGVLAPRPAPTPVVTAAAKAGIAFQDVTRAVGLAAPPPAAQQAPTGVGPAMTSGAAVTRLGGHQYLLLTSPFGPVQLYRYQGTGFTDVTAAAGLGTEKDATVAAFADVDADGVPDLLLAHRATAGIRLYLGRTDGTFHDATAGSGLGTVAGQWAYGASPRGLALADVDGDGDLDLMVADWNPVMAIDVPQYPGIDPGVAACRAASKMRALDGNKISTTRLYLGDGHGRFRDVSAAWGLHPDPIFAFTPLFADINGDGRPDLLLTGDVCSSRLYLNDGGRRFVEVTTRTKASMTPNGMGAVVTDLNGDGKPDWLVTGISYPTASGRCPQLDVISGCSGNRVFLGNGDGSFTDATGQTGLRDSGWAWGIAAEDFGNTGDRQVAVTNGMDGGAGTGTDQRSVYYRYFRADPMAFYVKDGSHYVDVAHDVGLTDSGLGHALLAFDYDGDGRQDILVNDSDTGPHLYRNVTPTTGRHWLTIRLHDSGAADNPDALGAKVAVTASGRTNYGWITSNTSFETQGMPELHVGLGAAAGPVTVRVWWPGTARPITYPGVAPDGIRTIERQR